MPDTLANPMADADNPLSPSEAVTSEGDVTETVWVDGSLGHHGDLVETQNGEPETEMAQGEEENESMNPPAKMIRVPRTPSLSERELHESVHLPHAEWCEFCMRGRGRNKPHRHRKEGTQQTPKLGVVEYQWENKQAKRTNKMSRWPSQRSPR